MSNWRGLPLEVPEERSPLPEVKRSPGASGAHGQRLRPGEIVGEYVVVRYLGEGGFGTVYEVTHPVIGKRAAVKVLHAPYSADPEFTSRFVAEARAVNQIRHKNIVDIFSFGDLPDGRHFYVMELLEGAPLDAYLDRRGQLPIDEALPILSAIAKALTAAHQAGLAHRDLKPENVFLELDREGFVHPKLLDFGMAKLLDSGAGVSHKTRSQAPVGSPRYMSPEQCRGIPVDARTDVYAFGCLAYRMLSGEAPFDASTALEIMMAHVSAQPVPPSRRLAPLAPEFDEPILRMLEKSPEARPQSVEAANEALLQAARVTGFCPDETALIATPILRELVAARSLPGPADASAIGTRQEPRRSALKSLLSLPKLGLVIVVTALSAWVGSRYVPRVPALPAEAATSSTASATAPAIAPPTATDARPLAAPQPQQVELTVQSQPTAAQVYFDGQALGTTPGPFTFEASKDPIQLELRAPGYWTAKLSVSREQSRQVTVTLKPRRARASSKTTPGDLEDPY